MYSFIIFALHLSTASPITRKILHVLLVMTQQTRKLRFKAEDSNTVSPVSLKAKTYLILTDIKSKLSNKPEISISKTDWSHINQLGISPATT